MYHNENYLIHDGCSSVCMAAGSQPHLQCFTEPGWLDREGWWWGSSVILLPQSLHNREWKSTVPVLSGQRSMLLYFYFLPSASWTCWFRVAPAPQKYQYVNVNSVPQYVNVPPRRESGAIEKRKMWDSRPDLMNSAACASITPQWCHSMVASFAAPSCCCRNVCKKSPTF